MKRFVVIACLLTGMASAAFGEDVAGSSDHPLVGRYQGSSIVYYKNSAFDEAALLRAPHDYGALLEKNDTKNRTGPEWLNVEGRRTQIRYQLPSDRSSLEVIRNFEAALKGNGFAVVFSCSDAACFSGSMRDLYLLGEQLDPGNPVSTAYSQHARYLLAMRDRAGGSDYVGLIVGEDQQERVAFAEIVESKPMDANMIQAVKADEMQKTLSSGQSVNLYGIQFDFDKDTVRGDSKPTLDEIGALLAAQPNLSLKLVGHTDNRGSAEYNQNLSERRAGAVVAVLVKNYGVDPKRLRWEGAGMTRPLVANDTEEGRSKNRRVELVAQ